LEIAALVKFLTEGFATSVKKSTRFPSLKLQNISSAKERLSNTEYYYSLLHVLLNLICRDYLILKDKITN